MDENEEVKTEQSAVQTEVQQPVGSAKKKSFWKRPRTYVIGGGALVVVVALVVGGAIFLNGKDEQAPESGEGQVEQLRDEFNSAVEKGGAKAGAAVYDEAIENESDKAQKTELRNQRTTELSFSNNPQAALESALEAAEKDETYMTLTIVSQKYEILDNKPKALEYLKRAYDKLMSDPNVTDYERELNAQSMRESIAEMEK